MRFFLSTSSLSFVPIFPILNSSYLLYLPINRFMSRRGKPAMDTFQVQIACTKAINGNMSQWNQLGKLSSRNHWLHLPTGRGGRSQTMLQLCDTFRSIVRQTLLDLTVLRKYVMAFFAATLTNERNHVFRYLCVY